MGIELLSSLLHHFAVHTELVRLQELHDLGDELLPIERDVFEERPAVLGLVVLEQRLFPRILLAEEPFESRKPLLAFHAQKLLIEVFERSDNVTERHLSVFHSQFSFSFIWDYLDVVQVAILKSSILYVFCQ
mgnify:CR=1 FL=1